MKKISSFGLAGFVAAGVLSLNLNVAGQHASGVVSFAPGGGTPAGYGDPASALGEPSRFTPGQFGGPVTPFAGPYLGSQLVALGAGGELTVRFDTPIMEDAAHSFGLDFIVFGNTFLIDADYPNSLSDGSFFGNNTGATRLAVSADGVNFFDLDPARAPVVDGFFPTDGAGDFTRAMNPALSAADFSGKDLTQIRALYGGSGGGTGFDLAWARDALGRPANLASASFVRVSVLTGRADVDGFAVVPEPAGGLLGLLLAGVIARRRRAGKRG